MRYLPVACLLGAILTLGGCENTPPPAPVAAAQPALDPTQQALRRAEAASTDTERASLYLTALMRSYSGGDLEQAAAIVSRISPYADRLGGIERFRLDEIALELALRKPAASDGAQVRAMLSSLRPVTRVQRLAVARFRARRAESGMESALAWIAVVEHPEARDPEQAAAATEAWRHLTRLAPLEAAELARRAPSAGGRAWAALARDYQAALTAVSQAQVWRDWRDAHPQHPATRFPVPELDAAPRKPKAIALLVPLDGPLGSAGKAVRDGFSAALLHDEAVSRAPSASQATTLRLYDTSTTNAAQAFRQAVSEGAELVVGPLRKSAVAEVAALPPAVPVLALNQLDDVPATAASRIPQLALAPETDASAIAAALADDAVKRIVLFHNSAPWAARAKARLLAERGEVDVVATTRLGQLSDVARLVGDALDVTASNQRRTELAAILGIDIEFTPRRRDDLDAVVALVSPQQFASLDAALRFHFADGVPVYAPWTAVGATSSQFDDVYVCGIPWELHPSGLRTAAGPLPASRGASAPWFAFGVDGFRLANQWDRLNARDGPIAGSTGMLALGPDGRISRQPAWAVIRGGRLVPHLPGTSR